MISKGYKIALSIFLVFLFVDISLVSCTSNLLKTSKSSNIYGNGNEKILGKVICIDGNKITLAIGNENNSERIRENSVDPVIAEQIDEKENIGEDNILFEPSGEEKIIEMKSNSIINAEHKNKKIKKKLKDITIGNILSVEYNNSNNIISVLIKDDNKYLDEY